MQLGQHISQRYNQELEDVRNQVLKMGGLVEQQSTQALQALLQHDAYLAESVADRDDQVNAMEVAIDEECTRVIAKRQPAASDLRLVIAVIKVITDLERIGDEAQKIARYAQKMSMRRTVDDLHSELSHLGLLVLETLRNALDAFARLDANKAVDILGRDRAIDKEFNNLSRLLITHMMEDPRKIKSALRVGWCARSLERIGDHAQNICEYVIYLVKGKDIRHKSLEHIRRKYFPDDALSDTSSGT